MKTHIAVIASMLIAGGCATHSWGSTVSVTYGGVVDATSANGLPVEDLDAVNLFGGGNLEGLAFVAVINFDPTLGVKTTDNATFSELDGGLAFGVSSPIISATYTTNGYSYSFVPDYYADVTTQSGAHGFVQQTGTSTAGDNSIMSFSTNAPARLEYTFTATGFGAGYLDTAIDSSGLSDVIDFAITGVVQSAAPEPSSWVLMIAGVGLAGAALRFSRRRSMAASA